MAEATPGYVVVPEETDPDAIAQEGFDYLEAKVEKWEPDDGQLDVWIIVVVARMIASLKDTATDVRTAIFRYYGMKIVQLPPHEATKALVHSTWKLSDSVGHVIEPGTYVGIPNAEGVELGFQVVSAVTVLAGHNETAVGAVELEAVEGGSEYNNLGGPGVEATLQDNSFAWLAETGGIKLTGYTGGGNDEETDEEYLTRLVEELRIMSPCPLRAEDYATLAKIEPSVYRALALDSYNALTLTEEVLCTTVVPVNEAGLSIGLTAREKLKAFLESKSLINMKVFVVDPVYTTIGVKFNITCWPEYAAAEVVARAEAAVATFINPSHWGQPPHGDNARWYVRETVKILDVSTVIGEVEGVKNVNSVETKKGSGAFGTVELTLEGGKLGLPQLGANEGTHT